MTLPRCVGLDPIDVLAIQVLVQIGEQLVDGEPRDIVSTRQIDVRRDADPIDVLAGGAEVRLDELKLSRGGAGVLRPCAQDGPDPSLLGAEDLVENLGRRSLSRRRFAVRPCLQIVVAVTRGFSRAAGRVSVHSRASEFQVSLAVFEIDIEIGI